MDERQMCTLIWIYGLLRYSVLFKKISVDDFTFSRKLNYVIGQKNSYIVYRKNIGFEIS